jgi:DNA polymerase elongation subunit (family B)
MATIQHFVKNTRGYYVLDKDEYRRLVLEKVKKLTNKYGWRIKKVNLSAWSESCYIITDKFFPLLNRKKEYAIRISKHEAVKEFINKEKIDLNIITKFIDEKDFKELRKIL